ncbi:MAG: RNase J family beta-CASP ribonuclease [Candidatus Woesearchaeota archaeon]
MPVEIRTIGGYGEVGKNMAAIKVDDEVIICDMGIHLENYISYTQDEDILNIHPEELISSGSVPDIDAIKDWTDNVKAIVPTHAHLDHIGAIPFLAGFYNAPVICTPFTGAVLDALISDAKISFKNQIKILNVNSSIKISNGITIEFISITHSTPQTVIVVIHTKYGKIVYANDFKFDKYPVVGTKPNIKRLKEIGEEKDTLCLIMDSLYAHDQRKMPSEMVARQMLKDVLLGVESEGKAVIITTFSSQIARLKSIIDYGKKTERKIIFLGRSLHKYVSAAELVNIVNFSEDIEIVKYSSKVRSMLNKVAREGRDKFILVVTGHQGEQHATLSRMIDGMFRFEKGDNMIFASSVIPSPTNQRNRRIIEDKLIAKGVRIFKDIHVSGHAAKEDHRDMIEILNPKHIIPAHSEINSMSALMELCLDLGYDENNIHLMRNGNSIKLID